MAKTDFIYQMVTDRITAELEKGNVIWRKPWTSLGGNMPRNLLSKKPYRGINLLLLSLEPYASPYWLTAKQANEKGGKIRKGEKSTVIIFWKILKSEKNGEETTIPLLRYYRVFNLEQCEGIDAPVEEAAPVDHDPIADADKIVAGYKNGPKIEHGGDTAAYVPAWDKIMLPVRSAFASPEAYYQTKFHELSHSTGHESRLNREGITGAINFGEENYSKEELVAELGAAMLSTVAGIDIEKVAPPSGAYIKHWLSKLQADPKLIVQAAAQAAKSSDHILGITYDN